MFKSTTPTDKLAKRAAALKARMSAKERCALAVDIGHLLDQQGTQDQERAIALAIVEKLVNDETERVRIAISKAIAHSSHLPRALAEQMARDINEVAIPVLELSPTFTEKFLEDVILSGATEKISAIARRQHLSPHLSQQIVASGRTKAVEHLLQNSTVTLENQTLVTVVRVYGDDRTVEEALLNRGPLPDEAVNALYSFTEAHVTTFIRRYFNLSEDVVSVQQGRNLVNNVPKEKKQWWDTKKGVV